MKHTSPSSYLNLLWPAVCTLLIIVSGFVLNPEPKNLSLTFKESFTIGEDTGPDAEYFMPSPYQIRTDKNQNIYIAEGLQRSIMVFGPQGEYLRSIGRVGRGPGEFPSGPMFNFTNEEEIVALDMDSQRFTWFSKEGEILSEYTPPNAGIVWSEKFFQSANGDNIMLKKPRRIGLDDPENYRNYVFHRYSNSFEEHIDSFGKFEELSPEANSEFVELVNTNMNSGHFVETDKGGFLYTPAIYNGKIYKFETSDNEWTIVDTFEGYMHWEEAVEPDKEGKGSMEFHSFDGKGGEQKGRGKINSYSIGLVKTSDGKVLHFSGQRTEDQDSMRTMIEVFNPEGDLIGTSPFDEITVYRNLLFFESHDPSLWMDEKDRFYYVDHKEGPVVRVGEIEGL